MGSRRKFIELHTEDLIETYNGEPLLPESFKKESMTIEELRMADLVTFVDDKNHMCILRCRYIIEPEYGFPGFKS